MRLLVCSISEIAFVFYFRFHNSLNSMSYEFNERSRLLHKRSPKCTSKQINRILSRVSFALAAFCLNLCLRRALPSRPFAARQPAAVCYTPRSALPAQLENRQFELLFSKSFEVTSINVDYRGLSSFNR